MKDWATVAFVFAMALTGWAQTLSTKDRLQITFSPDGILRDVRFAKKQFSGLGGFFVAEPTDTPEKLQWTPLKGKVELKGKTLVVQATGLGLGLTATFAEQPDAIFCEGILRDTSGSDRAIVLSFALPLDATNWQWWDNLRVARRIDPKTSIPLCCDNSLWDSRRTLSLPFLRRQCRRCRNCIGHSTGFACHPSLRLRCGSKAVAVGVGFRAFA